MAQHMDPRSSLATRRLSQAVMSPLLRLSMNAAVLTAAFLGDESPLAITN